MLPEENNKFNTTVLQNYNDYTHRRRIKLKCHFVLNAGVSNKLFNTQSFDICVLWCNCRLSKQQTQINPKADPSLGEDLPSPPITRKEMLMKAARTTHPGQQNDTFIPTAELCHP